MMELTLSKLDSSDKHVREKVYNLAREALAKKIKEKSFGSSAVLALQQSLEASINEIESPYRVQTDIKVDVQSNVSAPDQVDFYTDEVAPEEPSSTKLQSKPFGKMLRRPQLKTLLFGCLAIGLLATVYVNRDSLFGSVADSKQVSSNQQIIQMLNFPQDLDKFKITPKRGNSNKPRTTSDALLIQGQTTLLFLDSITVDREGEYFMTVKLKVNAPDKKDRLGALIGFATYDKDGRIERSKPGPHRYFVYRNSRIETLTKDIDDWFSLSGFISGVGANATSFRETTHSARPVLILNVKRPDQVTQIKSISIISLN